MTAVVQREENYILVIRTECVRPNPTQPRVTFDKRRLAELAESIVEFGQQVAIIVRELVDDATNVVKYEIIDGERRWRACQLAGIRTIRAEIRGAPNPDAQFVQSVVSNFGREDHTPLEAARAVARISGMPEYAALNSMERVRRIAALFARSPEWVYQQQRLMSLAPEVHELLDLPEGQRLHPQVAIFLGAIADVETQIELARRIVRERIKPPQARGLIRRAVEEHGVAPGRRARKPSDDAGQVSTRIRTIKMQAEIILDYPQKGLREYVNARPDRRETMVRLIDETVEALLQCRQGLAKSQALGTGSNR